MKNFILRWAIGLALLTLIVLRLGGQGLDVAFSQIDARTFIVVVLLDVPILLLASLRSHLLLASLGYRLPKPLLFSSVTLGFVAGSITPAASGELLRVEALRVHGGVPAKDSLAVIAFERVVSFYLIVMLAVASGAVVLLPLALGASIAAGVALLTFVPVLMVPAIRRRLRVGHERRSGNRVIAYLWDLIDRIERLADNRRAVTGWLLTSVALLGLVAVQFWLLARGVGDGAGFDLALFGLTGSQALGIVSLLPLGIGIADGSLAGILAPQLGTDGALAVALLVRATITLPLIVIAAASYLYLTTRQAVDAARARRSTPIVRHSDAA